MLFRRERASQTARGVDLPHLPGRVPMWLQVTLFGAAFWASAEAGCLLSVPGSKYVSFWLPAGIYVATLLLKPTRSWPWFLAAAFAANLLFDLPHGTPWLTFLGFYGANTVEALAGAWLVRRWVAEEPDIFTLRGFLGIVALAAGLGTLAGALVGALTLVLTDESKTFGAALLTWWSNESMAILLMTPFVLCWCSRSEAPCRSTGRGWKALEAALLTAALAVYTWHLSVEGGGIMSPYKFQLIPMLLWAGMRFGLKGATTITLGFTIWLGFLTSHFLRGLTPAELAGGAYVTVVQGFLAVCIFMALIPAIVLNERDRKVRELKESEARFRNLTEASFEAICISENGRILDVNDQGLKMMGLDRSEVIGRNVKECLPPESRINPLPGDASEQDSIHEHRLVRKDGKIIHAETRSKTVQLGQRTVQMTAVRDISERVRAEEALRLSEEKFRSAMLHSPIGMALVAPDGSWIDVNPAICKIVGYSPDELLATNFQAITHPDDLADDEDFVRQMLARKIDTYEMEKRYLHRLGHEVWVQLNVSLVFNPDGSPRHFVSQIQDISDRKRAVEALQKNQAKLLLSMDMAKLVHWEYDVDSNCLTCDENLFKCYGTTSEEHGGPSILVDDYIRKFIHPEDAKLILDEIAAAVATNEPNYCREFEKRFCRPDGSTGVVLTRFIIIKDAAGKTIKAYGVNQDITEQKQAEQQQKRLEEQLRQAQKLEALGTLAGGTAHEFNNMLGIITGFTELAKMELPTGHPVQAHLDETLKAGHRARDIIEQVLTFSRQQNQGRQPVQISQIVREALKAVRKTVPQTVTLGITQTADNPVVMGNATQIHQVLMNICVNAWHAMPKGSGSIQVSQQTVTLANDAGTIHPNLRNQSYVHLEIQDDGAGMDAATLARIFEPFFTTKPQGKGTGLGLAVAHGIMQSHEGAIFAQSAPGKGTTFHLYFPVSLENQAATDTPEAKPAAPGQGQHILLVDDEPSLTMVAAKFLKRCGYVTTGTNSAPQALEMVRNGTARFDLVITDLTMPGMNGTELATALYHAEPDLPVVVASGFGGAAAAEQLGTPNVRGFLQKPFTADALVRTVQEIFLMEEDASQNG